MKRLLIAAGVALFASVFGAVLSARAGATVDSFPVSFVLTSATCSNLAPGTTLFGSGTEQTITNVTNRNGVATLAVSSHARGTATDQNGKVYAFNYSNEFQGSFDESGVFSGRMNDAFSLAGSGPVRLSNGFTADIATDFDTFFSFPNVIRSYGDPIEFSNGEAHCDPL